VIAIYTDEYLNKLCLVPSVYERMRQEDLNVLVWVAMQHFYASADRLLLTKRTVVVQAFESYVEETVTKLATQKECRGDSTDAIRGVVERALGEHPHQQKVTDLLLSLRRQPRLRPSSPR
jgi:hypothetical protein